MAWDHYMTLLLLVAATLGLGQGPHPDFGLQHRYDCGVRGMQLLVFPRPGQTILFKVLGKCWQKVRPLPGLSCCKDGAGPSSGARGSEQEEREQEGRGGFSPPHPLSPHKGVSREESCPAQSPWPPGQCLPHHRAPGHLVERQVLTQALHFDPHPTEARLLAHKPLSVAGT